MEDDNLVEEDEYFIVLLSGGNEAINLPQNPTSRVTITDDDGKVKLSGSTVYAYIVVFLYWCIHYYSLLEVLSIIVVRYL